MKAVVAITAGPANRVTPKIQNKGSGAGSNRVIRMNPRSLPERVSVRITTILVLPPVLPKASTPIHYHRS